MGDSGSKGIDAQLVAPRTGTRLARFDAKLKGMGK